MYKTQPQCPPACSSLLSSSKNRRDLSDSNQMGKILPASASRCSPLLPLMFVLLGVTPACNSCQRCTKPWAHGYRYLQSGCFCDSDSIVGNNKAHERGLLEGVQALIWFSVFDRMLAAGWALLKSKNANMSLVPRIQWDDSTSCSTGWPSVSCNTCINGEFPPLSILLMWPFGLKTV